MFDEAEKQVWEFENGVRVIKNHKVQKKFWTTTRSRLLSFSANGCISTIYSGERAGRVRMAMAHAPCGERARIVAEERSATNGGKSYLADGYGVRLAIEAKPAGWVRFSELANAAAPPRIKQILVSPEHGVPYLNTSQAFDTRPKPRKWLAMGKTTKAAERLVKEGTILVMASATVGRAIVATKAHENAIISHHFMRVSPIKPDLAGWVYAFLRSPQGRLMIGGSQYASVIRHIEPDHLATLPLPEVSDEVAADFQKRVSEIVSCRNNAARFAIPQKSRSRRLLVPSKAQTGKRDFLCV